MSLKKAIPYLPVQHIEKAVTYYEVKFGFHTRYKEAGFAIIYRDDVEIHLWAADDDTWESSTNSNPIVSGAESFLAGTASCRIEVNTIHDLYKEYNASGVLYHSGTVIEETEWQTLEFPTLDLDGNLLTFFERVNNDNRARKSYL